MTDADRSGRADENPEPAEAAPTPTEMLALAEQQRARTEMALGGHTSGMFVAWGIAWLVGFGWLAATVGSAPPLDVPLGVALIGFFVCLFSAGIYTGIRLGHAARGLRGNSQTAGAMYGWSWALGFMSLSVLVGAVGRSGLSYDQIALLWSTGSGLVVGLMFLTGGALMLDWAQFGIGAWILLINGVGGYAGIPGHYLVMSLAGGGGLLFVAGFVAVRNRRSVRRARSA